MVAVPEVDASIRDMVDTIVREFRPLQVILFGSRARGDARPDSDVDILVVLPEADRDGTIEGAISRRLGKARLKADVITTTLADIARRGDLVGYILKPALQEGRYVYERCPRAQPGVMEADKNAAVDDWLRRAKADLELGGYAAGEGGFPDNACYLAQQAVEKLLKAALVFLQKDYPRTHNLKELHDLLPADWTNGEYGDLDWLGGWAITARYPEAERWATSEDAQAAISQAAGIWELITGAFQRRGFDSGTGSANG